MPETPVRRSRDKPPLFDRIICDEWATRELRRSSTADLSGRFFQEQEWVSVQLTTGGLISSPPSRFLAGERDRHLPARNIAVSSAASSSTRSATGDEGVHPRHSTKHWVSNVLRSSTSSDNRRKKAQLLQEASWVKDFDDTEDEKWRKRHWRTHHEERFTPMQRVSEYWMEEVASSRIDNDVESWRKEDEERGRSVKRHSTGSSNGFRDSPLHLFPRPDFRAGRTTGNASVVVRSVSPSPSRSSTYGGGGASIARSRSASPDVESPGRRPAPVPGHRVPPSARSRDRSRSSTVARHPRPWQPPDSVSETALARQTENLKMRMRSPGPKPKRHTTTSTMVVDHDKDEDRDSHQTTHALYHHKRTTKKWLKFLEEGRGGDYDWLRQPDETALKDKAALTKERREMALNAVYRPSKQEQVQEV
eukprot:CAMPEP_0178999518 /NCGR_PEP_ID=MMETSP0795-20121207/10112_1 /TAXON_ID=88552 /ORGANISM="Amoebophrya sp., Strain Ameob2" /LENGTH=419 /DNA_ID=CAMNT_0020692315 /DNA_START=53 /DNA_END=1312 /DNA_ORIENTATION=+